MHVVQRRVFFESSGGGQQMGEQLVMKMHRPSRIAGSMVAAGLAVWCAAINAGRHAHCAKGSRQQGWEDEVQNTTDTSACMSSPHCRRCHVVIH
jgi:hypothetical protein